MVTRKAPRAGRSYSPVVSAGASDVPASVQGPHTKPFSQQSAATPETLQEHITLVEPTIRPTSTRCLVDGSKNSTSAVSVPVNW